MTSRDLKIAAAEADREDKRARLLETVDELSSLFEPRKIVQEVWDTAKVKGADLAEDAVDAVKRRPVAASGAIAAIAMFLAREPIKDGIVSIYDAMTSKRKPKPGKAGQPASAERPPGAARPAQSKKPAARRTRKKTETKT